MPHFCSGGHDRAILAAWDTYCKLRRQTQIKSWFMRI
jgi:hypothetical protein